MKEKKLHSFLKNSYASEKRKKIRGYAKDDALSDDWVQVYTKNKGKKKKTVVVHRGTKGLDDVLTDIRLGLGTYKNTNRYKHALKIQRDAEAKYGAESITTVGHSLGGRLARDVGTRSKHIITYNSPIMPGDIGKTRRSNQTDIRTASDPVSALGPYFNNNKTVTLRGRTQSILQSHDLSHLLRTSSRSNEGHDEL
jgi:hypothetical protein